jgi:arginine repressor
MTLSANQQARVKKLLLENPDITVEQIQAKLGRDGVSISAPMISGLRADVLHCRRLLQQEGLVPAKAAADSEAPKSSQQTSSNQQARIKKLLLEEPDITVEQIQAKLGSDGVSVSAPLISELRADVLHCRRLLQQEGLVPAKAPTDTEAPKSSQQTSSNQQARIKKLLLENPDITLDEIQAKLASDGVSVSGPLIAELRADVLHCRRLLQEAGLLRLK